MNHETGAAPLNPNLDPGLLKAHKAYEAAINSNNADCVMAMYDQDAEILQPDGPTVSGLDNIRKWVEDYFSAYHTHWVKIPLKNFVFGDLGFDEGIDTAVDTPKDGGKAIHWDCKGILVYKRQPNGEWLIFRDIWNNTTPPQQVDPAPPAGQPAA
jgi:ketosteroid isomerase-like protein